MTDISEIKKELKKKVRALEKKIKNIEIIESLKKKRKLSLGSGGGGKRKKKEKKENEKDCSYPSKFAAIKRDFRSIMGDKRDLYNIFFIRFSLLERWVDETIVQNDDNILQFRMCSQYARQLAHLYDLEISGKEDH
jgi:hypothetical protein